MPDDWIDEIRRRKKAERDKASRAQDEAREQRRIFEREAPTFWENINRELRSLIGKYNTKMDEAGEKNAKVTVLVVPGREFRAQADGQAGGVQVSVGFLEDREVVVVNWSPHAGQVTFGTIVTGGALVFADKISASEFARRTLEPFFEKIA